MRAPRYPVYVPTRGRYATPLTIRFMLRDHVDFRAVIQADEYDEYLNVVGHHERLLVLPPGIPNLLETRKWIRAHATAEGHARHWQFDDNIGGIRRFYQGRRIPCETGPAIAAVEDFTDRYENIGVSGFNYQMFGVPGAPAYVPNVHVYSASLINHAMPATWRLVYNDDTDICLQALASGWATLLVNVFLVDKKTTMTMKGGNTDALYQGDGRMQMARALEREWPGIVKVKRKFGRVQHSVDWSKFRDDPKPRLREGIDLSALERDEYGLRLVEKTPVRSPALRDLMRLFEQETTAV